MTNRNLRLLVQLRWLAIAFQLGLMAVAVVMQLPILTTLFWANVSVQIGLNLGTYFWLRNRQTPESDWTLFFQLLFDLVALTVFVLASGGLSNPFSGLFLLQAVLATILIPKDKVWIIIAGTCFSYIILLWGFQSGHHDHHQWMAIHLYGMIVNHIISTVAIGIFAIRIVQNWRESERQMNARQSLVAAGLSAAQIAHQLGTPLNKMAFYADSLDTVQSGQIKDQILAEIDQCKQLLVQMGHSLEQLDSGRSQRMSEVCDKIDHYFASNGSSARITFEVVNDQNLTANAQMLLSQLIVIVLENATEADATEIQLKAEFEGKTLRLSITNNGAPITHDVQRLLSSGFTNKGGFPHLGMGLFLVRLITDSLNGTITTNPNGKTGWQFAFERTRVVD